MINARSHFNDRIDSDHRLVRAPMYRKNDFQRNKKSTVEKPSFGDVIKNLSDQQKSIRQKIYQPGNISNIIEWKRERATIQRYLRLRHAEILEKI